LFQSGVAFIVSSNPVGCSGTASCGMMAGSIPTSASR
jgi:hypothetical protein